MWNASASAESACIPSGPRRSGSFAYSGGHGAGPFCKPGNAA